MTTGYQPHPSPQGQDRGHHQSRRGRGHRGAGTRSLPAREALADPAESELADSFELPGGEMPADEHTVEILAEQLDEFTCGSCFLVRHRSQLAREKDGVKYCLDCEG